MFKIQDVHKTLSADLSTVLEKKQRYYFQNMIALINFSRQMIDKGSIHQMSKSQHTNGVA